MTAIAPEVSAFVMTLRKKGGPLAASILFVKSCQSISSITTRSPGSIR